MAKSIKFFNPKETPYGPLSNHYRYEMRIDGKQWLNITNYIYASILSSTVYSTVIKNTEVKNVVQVFGELYQKTEKRLFTRLPINQTIILSSLIDNLAGFILILQYTELITYLLLSRIYLNYVPLSPL